VVRRNSRSSGRSGRRRRTAIALGIRASNARSVVSRSGISATSPRAIAALAISRSAGGKRLVAGVSGVGASVAAGVPSRRRVCQLRTGAAGPHLPRSRRGDQVAGVSPKAGLWGPCRAARQPRPGTMTSSPLRSIPGRRPVRRLGSTDDNGAQKANRMPCRAASAAGVRNPVLLARRRWRRSGRRPRGHVRRPRGHHRGIRDGGGARRPG
jgi:hypothetical protein